MVWTDDMRGSYPGVVIHLDMEACQAEGLQFFETPEGIEFQGFGQENLIPPSLFAAAEDLDEGVWLMGDPTADLCELEEPQRPLFQFRHEAPDHDRASAEDPEAQEPPNLCYTKTGPNITLPARNGQTSGTKRTA